MFTTRAPLEMFRQQRTHRQLQRLYRDLDKFLAYGNRDWHTAVEFGLAELAEQLCQHLGHTGAARQFGDRRQQALETFNKQPARKPRRWGGKRPRAAAAAPEAEAEAADIVERVWPSHRTAVPAER